MPLPGSAVALATSAERASLWSPDWQWVGSLGDLAGVVRDMEAAARPRWTWWSAAPDVVPVVSARVHLARAWDIAESHRLQHGGWSAWPGLAWASAHRLDRATIPAAATDDLFGFASAAMDSEDPDAVVLSSGHLRPDAGTHRWLTTDDRLQGWARAAYECRIRQVEGRSVREIATVHSESAAALLCVELERDGLPIDRPEVERLIAASAGPRPATADEALAARRDRDRRVLDLVPGAGSVDLRNPARVLELLASLGITVPNTRKWVLDAYREVHPVVPALLAWRAEERITTTYGYGWLDAHVGPDDRLRGRWTASDGAAGRMTAQNGLHNLPASLRPAVAAEGEQVFVRADLGQIEPRVLAAVSGDPTFAAATRADDLYAPVAERLRVERPVAKVAVLAAMYGQRSGAAGEALAGLERAYPVAMAHLDRAYAAGVRGEPVHTFGGRLVRTDYGVDTTPVGQDPALDAGRGRFARNAVIQGSAAELFKAWAATVRATTRDLGAAIVLCLHDELLIQVPEGHATETVIRVGIALDDAARRWTGSREVRFVTDTSVVRRWSEAKS
ncbi:MAG: DNA polymerase [Nostocoides sp.]